MNKALAALTTMKLKNFPDDELAAINLAIEFGTPLDPILLGFDRLIECKLIRPDGEPYDQESLTAALTSEVLRRLDSGS